MPDPRSRPTIDPGEEPVDDAGAPIESTVDSTAKKKKDKVRAAWISFVGRIVAQVVGAAVTVALTLFVVQQAQQSRVDDIAISPVDTSTTSGTRGMAAASASSPTSSDAPVETAIAVLPLENHSGDPGQDYFVDGMTEALIAELARFKDLRVISRTSSMRYRGSRLTLPEIARELGVTHIIEGSVARDQGRVRVTAQLIDAASDRHVWAESYDRRNRDVLDMQAEVAVAIAREIADAITRDASGTIAAVETVRQLRLRAPTDHRRF